jgi:glucose-6-phosphate isomerase
MPSQRTDLSAASGLPLSFDAHSCALEGGKGLCIEGPEMRTYGGNEGFFEPAPASAPLDKSKVLYYIYRNAHLSEHGTLFSRTGLRYDVTVLAAGTIGNEHVRTIGHIHTPFGAARVGPAEAYEVIYGTATFYLEHPTKEECYAIAAPAGSRVIVPGNWAHITINASAHAPLVIANLFMGYPHSADYGFFARKSGPSFYPYGNNEEIFFQKNPRQHDYKKIVKIGVPSDPFSLPSAPLYSAFAQDPESFGFLAHPSRQDLERLESII